jgi:endonuclease-8
MAKTHPLSLVKKMPRERVRAAAATAREFSLVFYEVKQTDTQLNTRCHIYRKRICPSCSGKITGEKTGTRKRISFFCPTCQVLYR